MVYLRACLAFAVGNEPAALQLAPVWLARQRAFDSLAALAYFLDGCLHGGLRPARHGSHSLVRRRRAHNRLRNRVPSLYPPIRGEEGHCGASHARASQLLEGTAEADTRC